jgi:hypothetical protein
MRYLTLLLVILITSCNDEWTAEPANAYWDIVLQYEGTIKKTATTVSWNDTAGCAEELLPANTTGEYRIWQKRIVCKEFDTITVHVEHAITPSLDSGFVVTIYAPCQSGRWIKIGQFQSLSGPISEALLVRVLPSKSTYYTN